MSVEFDELAKARENPTEEMASKFFEINVYIFSLIIIIFVVFTDLVEFSDEEGYGKYLDLHECYEKYINLKGIEVIFFSSMHLHILICVCFRKWIILLIWVCLINYMIYLRNENLGNIGNIY